MELARETRFNLDLSGSGAEVIAFTYTGAETREVVARVNLGVAPNLLGGAGGNYELQFHINTVLITPNSEIPVDAGITKTIMVSRQIPIEQGDFISIIAVGEPADSDVDTTATLRDATPLRAEEIFGSGTVAVDHNYGGTDALRYVTEAGSGIADAEVRAYLAADYDAGRRDVAYVKGTTTTDVNGRFRRALMLFQEDYVIYYFKQNSFGPDIFRVVVA